MPQINVLAIDIVQVAENKGGSLANSARSTEASDKFEQLINQEFNASKTEQAAITRPPKLDEASNQAGGVTHSATKDVLAPEVRVESELVINQQASATKEHTGDNLTEKPQEVDKALASSQDQENIQAKLVNEASEPNTSQASAKNGSNDESVVSAEQFGEQQESADQFLSLLTASEKLLPATQRVAEVKAKEVVNLVSKQALDETEVSEPVEELMADQGQLSQTVNGDSFVASDALKAKRLTEQANELVSDKNKLTSLAVAEEVVSKEVPVESAVTEPVLENMLLDSEVRTDKRSGQVTTDAEQAKVKLNENNLDVSSDKVTLDGVSQASSKAKTEALKAERSTAENSTSKETVVADLSSQQFAEDEHSAEEQFIAQEPLSSVATNSSTAHIDKSAGTSAPLTSDKLANDQQSQSQVTMPAQEQAVEQVTAEHAAQNRMVSEQINQGQNSNSHHSRIVNQTTAHVVATTAEQTEQNSEQGESDLEHQERQQTFVDTSSLVDRAKTVHAEQKSSASPALFDLGEAMAPTVEAETASGTTESLLHKITDEGLVSTQSPLSKTPVVTQTEVLSIYRKDFSQAMKDKVMFMINQKLQQVDIQLDPPELGNVQVRVNLQGEQATVNIVVQNQQAKDVLEENVNKLKDMLAQSGIDLGDTNIEQQSQQGEQGSSTGQGGHSQQAGQQEEMPSQLQRVNKVSSIGVDYFA